LALLSLVRVLFGAEVPSKTTGGAVGFLFMGTR